MGKHLWSEAIPVWIHPGGDTSEILNLCHMNCVPKCMVWQLLTKHIECYHLLIISKALLFLQLYTPTLQILPYWILRHTVSSVIKSVKMPKVGTPEFNWEAPCLEQELIRCESVVEDNWKVNNTTDEGVKAAYIGGWIDDKGTQYLRKYTWGDGKWDKCKLILERFKEKIQPKVDVGEINTGQS